VPLKTATFILLRLQLTFITYDIGDKRVSKVIGYWVNDRSPNSVNRIHLFPISHPDQSLRPSDSPTQWVWADLRFEARRPQREANYIM
jgi:hypothetical protein